MLTQPAAPEAIEYPCSDGRPMADNTKQARWMNLLYDGLAGWFASWPNVFVAMDLLWYLVEGDNSEGKRVAPDLFVAFGRPKGGRMCWLPWEEGGISPQVVFEIISPSNDEAEMARKFLIYEDAGVKEYYTDDPDTNQLQVFVRGKLGSALVRARLTRKFVSPLMAVTFDITGPELAVYAPDGTRFLTAEERPADLKRREAHAAALEAALVTQQQARADAEAARADAEAAATRLARIVELGRKARRGAASAEELAELDRLDPPA